jgi:plasmid maintenance system antidote protein VapI
MVAERGTSEAIFAAMMATLTDFAPEMEMGYAAVALASTAIEVAARAAADLISSVTDSAATDAIKLDRKTGNGVTFWFDTSSEWQNSAQSGITRSAARAAIATATSRG